MFRELNKTMISKGSSSKGRHNDDVTSNKEYQ